MRSILLSFLFTSSFLNAQNYFPEHFGGSVGLVLNMGTHVDAVGINFKGYYTDYFFQVNAGSTFYFYSKGYAERKMFWENRSTLGLVLLAGKKNTDRNLMLDGLNHQTAYNYGAGYSYIWYFDNAQTTQRSGSFGIHIKEFSLIHENDLFGGYAHDRFRTGRAYANFRYKNWQFAAGMFLWTGDSRGAKWQRLSMDKCPNGFSILEDQPYGRTSHGILYASASYHFPYAQTATLRIGLDSERIRHGLQNRLIHDLIFLPKSVKPSTPHYPRLDPHGCPVFDVDKIRKDKFYFQLNANDNWAN